MMRSRPPRPPAVLAAALAASVLLLVGCAPEAPAPADSAPPSPTATRTADPLDALSLEQRVGQLFMVGTPATGAQQETLDAVTGLHVGNVFLAGRSTDGVDATRAVVERFTSLVDDASTAGVPLFVATDQEGGKVQVLRGPGFSEIPSALEQGALDPAELQRQATQWGAELSAAGITMDLGPVIDIVPDPAAVNPPIGGFQRQFGADLATVEPHATAFRAGLEANGVVPVIKHFPGLGHVTANTDTTAGVTDTVVTAESDDIENYRRQIAAGATAVMMSTAVYANLDPSAPAAFSPIVTGLLRDGLGFDGLIMTDDLSAAKQVAAWTPGERAVLSIAAGADIVLVSASPELAPEMVAAVVARAQDDPAFAALVDAAARRVLAAKAGSPTG